MKKICTSEGELKTWLINFSSSQPQHAMRYLKLHIYIHGCYYTFNNECQV